MNHKQQCTLILFFSFISFFLCPILAQSQQVSLTTQQFPIDISGVANANWCPYLAGCSGFPLGSHMYNAVKFEIPGTSTTNNAWFAYAAAGGGSGDVSVTVPVNVANVKTVYTLVNTEWGSSQSGLLTVTFIGSNGTTWSYDLLGNVDVRDYFYPSGFTNSIQCRLPSGEGKTGTISAWKGRQGGRLDMQIFQLPTSFDGQTLVSMTITDRGNTNVQRSFLAAVTASTALP